MFGKIATPPNGTVFILIILVVLALFFGNHYSICTEVITISKQTYHFFRLDILFDKTATLIGNATDWNHDQKHSRVIY